MDLNKMVLIKKLERYIIMVTMPMALMKMVKIGKEKLIVI